MPVYRFEIANGGLTNAWFEEHGAGAVGARREEVERDQAAVWAAFFPGSVAYPGAVTYGEVAPGDEPAARREMRRGAGLLRAARHLVSGPDG